MLNFIFVHTDFGVERGEFEKYQLGVLGSLMKVVKVITMEY